MYSNQNEPLVSIITPCYNGAKFIRRFLDSVLNQTYNNIELILINDGSKDGTEEIVLSYQEKIRSKGISFTYIYQNNKGAAGAINKGLEIFKGKYFTCPDSDDILHPDNIKEKVLLFEENSELGMVMCKARILDEETLETIGTLERVKPKGVDNVFSDFINEKNVYCPGHMIRSSFFLKELPDREIYESQGGQNWQLILPVLYKYKCGYVAKYLYDYLARKDSHSRNLGGYGNYIKRSFNQEEILTNVINSIIDMPNEERLYWLEVIKIKYLRKRLIISSQFGESIEMNRYYMSLRLQKGFSFSDKMIYISGKYLVARWAISPFRLFFRFVRKIKRWICDR